MTICDTLLQGLTHPNAAVRLDVVRVIGMVEETQALDRLRALYPVESDEAVRRAMAWAGQRLHQARQAGYLTVDALCSHFGVDRAVEEMPDATEAELMERFQQQLDRDLLALKERMARHKAGMAVAMGVGGTLLGGASLGMMAMVGALQPGADVASSSLGTRGLTRRAPATRPSDTPIDVWVRRLRTAITPKERAQAALELAQLNNPRALPHLAAACVGDEAPEVRQTAERCGKVLYWSVLYWEMEQNGTLAQEIERRARALGKTVRREDLGDAAVRPSAPPVDPAPVDVDEILRRAQQARNERKRKKV